MGKKKKYRGPRLFGQWVPHPVMMIGILQRLSLAARRILDCLEIENSRHAGRENGRLVCTFTKLERHVPRSCIRRGLDELLATGLIEITRLGRPSYADLRNPSLYRLTYLHTFKDGVWVAPTHEWKKQKARPESTTGNGQKPDRNPTPQRGQSQTGIHHSLLDLGEEGGGLWADVSLSLPSAHPQGGAGLDASPLPSSLCRCLGPAPFKSAVGAVASGGTVSVSSANGHAAAFSNGGLR